MSERTVQRYGVRKLSAIAAAAARRSLRQRGALVGRAAFYLLLLLVFSRVWRVVSESGAASGLDQERALAGAAAFVWYLAITEWIVLSLPELYLEIEQDVRSGELAYRLAQPVDYVASKIAEGLGALVVRATVLGITGVVGAWWLSGSGPPLHLSAALVTGGLGILIGVVFTVSVGLTAVWTQDARPIYWVWQKLGFILGGLILPLDVYPEWLRSFAEWTPFHAYLYGGARWSLGFSWSEFASQVAVSLAWLGVLGLILHGASRIAWRRLDLNGG